MPESLDQEIRTLQTIFWSELDPEGLAFAPLADAFRRKGDVRGALDLLTDGMSRHPDYATGHVVATRLYLDQGMDSEAELAARRVLALDSENLVALSTLAIVLAARGEAREAAGFKDSLLAVDPESDEARAVADLATAGAGVEPESAASSLDATDVEAPADVEGPAEAERPAEAMDIEAPAELVDLEAASLEGAFDLDAPGLPEPAPETLHGEGDPESLFDDLTLAPADGGSDTEQEEGGDELGEAMAALGLSEPETSPDAVPGPEVEFPDLEALESDEPVEEVAEPIDLGGLSLDEPEDDALDVAALAPDDEDEAAVDLASLAPDEPEGEVMDLAALAPDEPADDALDVAALAPDDDEEAAVDLASLAPDEPEGEVMDLAALAPDEPADDALDVAALAPDDEDEAAVDLASLAPDEPEGEVMDLAALAPDEPADDALDVAALAPDDEDEAAVDLASLAPDEPEGEVMDLAALAPDEPADDVVELASLAPDAPDDDALDVAALAPDEPWAGPPEESADLEGGRALPNPDEEQDEMSSEPVYTRTLADLYVKQGFTEKALEVLRHLQERDPEATDLAERIEALERGEEVATGLGGPSRGAGHTEEDVEERARVLAESGGDGDDVDTPFAWDESTDEPTEDDEDGIGGYFESLLGWEDRPEP